MNILEILQRYTDENHRLSQREIGEILEREYGVRADRKTVKRNLTDLIEAGYDLEYSESIRKNREGEEEILLTDWYLNRTFTDSELRLLIDGLLFSKHIPYSQCRDLVKKLEGLGRSLSPFFALIYSQKTTICHTQISVFRRLPRFDAYMYHCPFGATRFLLVLTLLLIFPAFCRLFQN